MRTHSTAAVILCSKEENMRRNLPHATDVGQPTLCMMNGTLMSPPSLTSFSPHAYRSELRAILHSVTLLIVFIHHRTVAEEEIMIKLECGPMPNVMAAQPNIGGALCKSCSAIPFLVPRSKVWSTPAAGVPCSNAANIGERKTWT